MPELSPARLSEVELLRRLVAELNSESSPYPGTSYEGWAARRAVLVARVNAQAVFASEELRRTSVAAMAAPASSVADRLEGRREMAIAAVNHLIDRRTLHGSEIADIRTNLLDLVHSLPLIPLQAAGE